MWAPVGPSNQVLDPLTQRGKFERKSWLAQDMSGGRTQRNLAGGSTGTVYMPIWCTRWGEHWRHLANTIEPSVCGSNAVLCQIILTTCYSKSLTTNMINILVTSRKYTTRIAMIPNIQ